MSGQSVKDYLNLPCTIEFIRDTSDAEHPVWFAAVRELRGCMTEANDFDEATRQIRDAGMDRRCAGSRRSDRLMLAISEQNGATR